MPTSTAISTPGADTASGTGRVRGRSISFSPVEGTNASPSRRLGQDKKRRAKAFYPGHITRSGSPTRSKTTNPPMLLTAYPIGSDGKTFTEIGNDGPTCGSQTSEKALSSETINPGKVKNVTGANVTTHIEWENVSGIVAGINAMSFTTSIGPSKA